MHIYYVMLIYSTEFDEEDVITTSGENEGTGEGGDGEEINDGDED